MLKDTMSDALFSGKVSYDDLLKELNDAKRDADARVKKQTEEEKAAKKREEELEEARYYLAEATVDYLMALGTIDSNLYYSSPEYEDLIEDTIEKLRLEKVNFRY